MLKTSKYEYGEEGRLAIYSKAKKGIVGTFSLGMPRKSRKRWSTFS